MSDAELAGFSVIQSARAAAERGQGPADTPSSGKPCGICGQRVYSLFELIAHARAEIAAGVRRGRL